MDILIKNVTIIHEGSDYHLKIFDILINNGKILSIAKNIDASNVKIIEGKKMYCCIGLCDIGTGSGEPGYEHRESLQTLTQAAMAGGYTALAVFPNNKPITQSKADIKFLIDHHDLNGVKIFPIGALSKDLKGQDIGEYMDMASAGAVAFSDGLESVKDTGLLSRALQYSGQINGIVIHHPNDHYLSQGGEMHEGEMSTSLGIKGVPEIAEVHVVQRDILLNAYNEGNLILHCISTATSIEDIKSAKKDQKSLFATVAYMNLLFTDEDMGDFDTNLKVSPVLRSKTDKEALIAGLSDGSLDAIVSNHAPLDEESKNLEFTYATPGASGLETCLIACVSGLKNLIELPTIIHKLTIGPRKLLNISIPQIAEGHIADLCVFDIGDTYTYNANLVKSKSANNPFIDKNFEVRILATLIG
ncbi:MAG: dihydroorotase [Saprospiraceae bacterium]|nr:dihydroorotase [Saprospiraceae bacterium]